MKSSTIQQFIEWIANMRLRFGKHLGESLYSRMLVQRRKPGTPKFIVNHAINQYWNASFPLPNFLEWLVGQRFDFNEDNSHRR